MNVNSEGAEDCKQFCLLLLHVCMTCEFRHQHATVHIWRPEDNFVELPVIFEMNSCCQDFKANTLATDQLAGLGQKNFMVNELTITNALKWEGTGHNEYTGRMLEDKSLGSD